MAACDAFAFRPAAFHVAMLAAAILFSAFATAVLSAVLGMAGGLVLMGALVWLLPVASAMVLHGAVQAASNGARWLFLRQHTRWRIMPPYLAGTALAAAAFAALSFVPAPSVVLMLIGAFPWLARVAPKRARLDVCKPFTGFCCGLGVTAAQLLAGASGPLLDAFYLRASLNRYEVVASKAFTQTLGHLAKLGYYGALIGSGAAAGQASPWLTLAACGMAIGGARIGTRLLRRLDEARFRRVGGAVVLALGAACFGMGAWQLI